MHASESDIKNLFELQKIDAEIKSTLASLDSMPEIKKLSEVLSKQKEAKAKFMKVDELRLDAEKRLEKMEIEDVKLANRESSVQEAIEEAVGDFRNLEVHTKELDSIGQRRETLAGMMLKAADEQEKISEVLTKLKEANGLLEEKKKALQDKIQDSKDKTNSEVNELNKQRETIKNEINEGLADLYEQSTKKVGNVVLGKVEDGACSVCKTRIEEGKLIDMLSDGEIATCPSCSRILVLK